MDALALLCTLHADGPATLKRFRHAGCTSLEHLQSIEIERLASLLGSSPAAAKRFLREAKSLGERVGRGILDREEQGLAPRAIPSDAEPAIPSYATIDPNDLRPPNLGAREQAIVDRVLETWRERDREESACSELEEASSAEPEMETATGAMLAPGAIDGLDEHSRALLGALGIGDLESLARIDALDIARRTGIAYTKLARLRFLAARDAQQTARDVRGSEPVATARRPSADPRAGVAPARAAQAPRAAHHKFSMSEKPPEPTSPILDLERDLHAAPRAPLPVGSSRGRAHVLETQGERSSSRESSSIGRRSSGERLGPGERAGGPFV